MRLYFVRHAQSGNNALWQNNGTHTGRSEDPELTELGQQQTQALATHLKNNNDPLEKNITAAPGNHPLATNGYNISHLYCSPMLRAIETAMAASNAINIAPVVWEDWHETGGIWLEENGVRVGKPGKSREYLEQRFPNIVLPEHYGETGWWSREYEEEPAAFRRAKKVWQELLARHGQTNDRVMVVSHGHFFGLLMAAIFNLVPGEQRFMLHNTGLCRIDYKDAGWKNVFVPYTNHLAHLAEALITI